MRISTNIYYMHVHSTLPYTQSYLQGAHMIVKRKNSHSNNIFITNSNVACLIMQFFPFPFNIALLIFYVDPEKISEQLQLPLRKQQSFFKHIINSHFGFHSIRKPFFFSGFRIISHFSHPLLASAEIAVPSQLPNPPMYAGKLTICWLILPFRRLCSSSLFEF